MIVLVSAKHSGVTTGALALTVAAALEGENALLVEADPNGGELAARLGRSLDPGLLSIAAAQRQGLDAKVIEAHTQRLSCGAATIVAPLSPTQTSAALLELSAVGASALADWSGPVVADCGRWRYPSASSWLIESADTILVVTHPTLAGVEHVRARSDELAHVARRVGLVLVGERPYSPGEVEAATGIPVVGTLPWDRRGVQDLADDRARRALSRTLIVRAARTILTRLAEPVDRITFEEARR